ncbi:MAG: NADH-quinone oxidoreductase chain I [Candidatus Latescibacterota bacterium]|jgi:NADH-quinone oxidoreductase chain I
MPLIKDIYVGALSLLVGMKVTVQHFLRPPVTSQYPKERLEMTEAYRNVIVLIEKEDIGSHDCIACKACERVCPSFCIALDGGKLEGIKRQRVSEFTVDFALCSECGLCLDVCPTDTLGYSRTYDEAGYSRKDFHYDLLDPWRDTEEATLERLRKSDAEKEAAKALATAARKKAAAEKAAKEAAAKAVEEEETPTEGDAPAAKTEGGDA